MKSTMVQSYGKIDDSWDESRFREVLSDASKMANVNDSTYYIGEDKKGNVGIHAGEHFATAAHIFACGVSKVTISDHRKENFSSKELDIFEKQEFWDRVEYKHYTIDEMVPRVYDCLVNGIIEWGNLGFLSEGRMQLSLAIDDVVKLVEKHNVPFIIGKLERGGIMIAPVSKRSEFIAPRSGIATKSDFWSISDLHSSKLWTYSSKFAPKESRWDDPFYTKEVMIMLYLGIAYGQKEYGQFQPESGIVQLEHAFEDAAKLARIGKHKALIVSLSYNDRVELYLKVRRDRMRVSKLSFDVSEDEFWDGDVLMLDKVQDFARDAYEQIMKSSPPHH